MPQGLRIRARIILLAAEGWTNTAIAAQMGLSKPTVGLWRQRYLAQCVHGLYDELCPGGPCTIRDEQIAALIRKTLKTKPEEGTHWTCRALATETRFFKSTVIASGWPPGSSPTARSISSCPLTRSSSKKVRDIVGLYLNLPDHAIVLAVDEKSQIQALDRSQPLIPLGPGYVGG